MALSGPQGRANPNQDRNASTPGGAADRDGNGGRVGPQGRANPLQAGGRVNTAGQPNPTGRPDGRAPGPQGRASPSQTGRPDPLAGGGTGQGDGGQTVLGKLIEGFFNPVTEDPVLNAGIKALPVVGQVAGIVGALQNAGVPTSPADTAGGYPDPNRDVGITGPQWLQDDGLSAAPTGALVPDEPDAPPTIPGNIWTSGGVTPTRLPSPIGKLIQSALGQGSSQQIT